MPFPYDWPICFLTDKSGVWCVKEGEHTGHGMSILTDWRNIQIRFQPNRLKPTTLKHPRVM